jgi:class 3 adenylate cyclase/tetratricopeptide (TPR) repeat protein
MSAWTCAACRRKNPDGTRFCGHCGAARAALTSDPEVSEELLRGVVAGRIGDRLTELGETAPQERRLVTALFADVSGFTTLADRLEPEQLLEVIDPVIARLSGVVTLYEGYIEKFAGDALLALFGAPIAHEDDAERALLAAMEMHRELARVVGELPHDPQLTLHVGVNSGHGIGRILGSEARTDYAVLGDSVILAQRLESAAPKGETYVSQLTYELTRHRFDLEPVGELTLKGKTKTVTAWKLLRERPRPLRERPARAHMVGRARELVRVVDALDGVTGGHGTVVTITGEPGVGKSRLAEEARLAAEERELRWLQARCLSYGAALPYWPVADLLRRVDEAGALADAFLARLIGADSPETEGLEPEALQRGIHRAVLEWLEEQARERPLVVAVEDVHWIDSASLALLGELARAETPAPVALLLSARPEGETALAETFAERLAIRLAPLDEAGVAELLEAMLGSSPPRGLAAFLGRRTAGNPFFVQELMRMLEQSGALTLGDSGRWRLRPGWDARELPLTVEEVLAGRMDLLPVAAGTALQTAAVIGRRASLELLRAITFDVARLDESLDELVTAAFLDWARDDGVEVLVFRHALVQDVAYERMLRRTRRELHLRVADRAEALYGAGDDTVDLLARHLYLGQAGRKAVAYLERAGERARSLYANEQAILHLERALELAPEDESLRLDVADLHELVGNYETALGLYEEVRAATNDARAWRGAVSALRKQGDYETALSVIDGAFATLPAGADDSVLWLDRGITLSITGVHDLATRALEGGLASARTYGNAPVEAQLLTQLARLEGSDGRGELGLEHARSAQAICEHAGDLRRLATALRVGGLISAQLGRFGDALIVLRRGLELAYRVGSSEEVAASLLNLGLVEAKSGDYGQAIAHTTEALDEFERIGHQPGTAQSYCNLAGFLEETDQLDAALDYCRKAEERARALGHKLAIADTLNTLACVRLKRDQLEHAAETAEDAADLYLDVGDEAQAREVLEIAADAWSKLGDELKARGCRARASSVVSSLT